MAQRPYVMRGVRDPERGRRIAALRQRHQMTQPVAADAIGVALRTYQLWEAGENLTWGNLQRLAEAFHTSPELILDVSEGPLKRIEDKLDELLERVDRLERALRST